MIEAPGGVLAPAEVTYLLRYSEGADGPPGGDAEPGESVSALVERTPEVPRVIVTIDAIERELGLLAGAAVSAGLDDFYFLAHFVSLRPIVPPGASETLCVDSLGGPTSGELVAFSLDGPGSLSETAVATEEVTPFEEGPRGRACTDYTAPPGAVGRDLRPVVTATSGDKRDFVEVHPFWADVFLRADVGAGYEEATHRTLGIAGAGPYPIEVRVEAAGATTGDAPQPVAGATVQAAAAEPTLQRGGDCCSAAVGGLTAADGRLTFAWRANGSASSEHTVEVLATPFGPESLVGASVTLAVEAWTLHVEFPAAVAPGADEPLEVAVRKEGSGEPVPGAFVSVEVSGGSVASASGVTGASGFFQTTARLAEGEPSLTLTVRASATPGGPPRVERQVVASAAGGSWRVVSRFHEVTVELGSEVGDTASAGGGQGRIEARVDLREGEARAVAFSASNVIEGGSGLIVSASGSSFVAGGDSVELNRGRILVEVIGAPVPYAFRGSVFRDGAGTVRVTLEGETPTPLLEGCMGDGCAEGDEVSFEGELPPGRYLFETQVELQSGSLGYSIGLVLGENFPV